MNKRVRLLYAFLIVVILGDFGALFFILRSKGKRRAPVRENVHTSSIYHGKVEEPLLNRIDNDFLDNPRKKFLLLEFFTPEPLTASIPVIHTEALRRTYEIESLSIVGISSSDSEKTLDFKRRYKISFPLIADKDLRLHRYFGVSECCGGVFVIDKRGIVRYSSRGLLSKERLIHTLSQEFVPALSKEIASYSEQSPFVVGKTFPSIQISSPTRDIDFSDLHGKYLVVTLFSVTPIRCSKCKGALRAKTLNRLVNKLGRYNIEVIGIVVYPVQDEDLIVFKNGHGLKYSLFSTEDLQNKFEKYPLTLVLNERGIILLSRGGEEPEEKVTKDILDCIKRVKVEASGKSSSS